MTRIAGGRCQSRTMLILAEGPSEVRYFERFRGLNRHLAIVPIAAKRHDTKNLITYCKARVYERGIDFCNGDSVSIVIDVDNHSLSELMEVEKQCSKNGFTLYLSNRSFECWLIMHFHDLTKPMSQEELEDELTCCIDNKYRKSEGINRCIKEEDVKSAINRAIKKIPSETGCNSKCGCNNPSTTVHFLVMKIMSEVSKK